MDQQEAHGNPVANECLNDQSTFSRIKILRVLAVVEFHPAPLPDVA